MKPGLSVFNEVGVGWIVEITEVDEPLPFEQFAELVAEVVAAIGPEAEDRLAVEIAKARASHRQDGW